VGGAEGI